MIELGLDTILLLVLVVLVIIEVIIAGFSLFFIYKDWAYDTDIELLKENLTLFKENNELLKQMFYIQLYGDMKGLVEKKQEFEKKIKEVDLL